MNQAKIGQFIAACRKNANLTQAQLAEKLNITDRAVSKWETGKAMPDSSLMLPLCAVLGIRVNDLLCGEVVTMDNYNKELENNLLDMIRQKEQADRQLLTVEIVTGILCLIPLLSAVIAANVIPMSEGVATALVLAGLVPLLVATPFMLRIEQTAGYYACAKCGHKYIPTYTSVFVAMHLGRTRYMRCPECGKRGWHKKVLRKD